MYIFLNLFNFALLINKARGKDMKRIKIGKTLAASIREMLPGEEREILLKDTRETTIRVTVHRQNKDGRKYAVNLVEAKCVIKRIA